MIGSLPFIQSSGLNNNAKTYLRVDSITRSTKKNIFSQSIPGTNNSPNTEVDFLGTNNRVWNISATLPVVSGVLYSDGLGAFHANEISISGLSVLEVTGSKIWFYDEIATIRANINSHTLLYTTSGTWVEVASVDFSRNSDYVNQEHEVGYIIPYKLTLMETK